MSTKGTSTSTTHGHWVVGSDGAVSLAKKVCVLVAARTSPGKKLKQRSHVREDSGPFAKLETKLTLIKCHLVTNNASQCGERPSCTARGLFDCKSTAEFSGQRRYRGDSTHDPLTHPSLGSEPIESFGLVK